MKIGDLMYTIIDQGHDRWLCVGYEKWEARPSRLYNIGHDKRRGVTWCSCPAGGVCKHIRMMRDRRRKPGLWYFVDEDKWKKENLI